MGLFDKLKKRNSDESPDSGKVIADIFRVICGDEETVTTEIDLCVNSPKNYALKNEKQFVGRGLSADDTDADTLMWIGCVDILIKNAYAAELDFSCEIGDFIFGLNELVKLTSENIILEEDDFDAGADITVWLDELDERLKERGLCIGGVDIDSDSYVVFMIDIKTLGRLKANANSIGHKIDCAKNL